MKIILVLMLLLLGCPLSMAEETPYSTAYGEEAGDMDDENNPLLTQGKSPECQGCLSGDVNNDPIDVNPAAANAQARSLGKGEVRESGSNSETNE